MNTSIAILGGSFDPVHNGHTAIAHSVQQALTLQSIYCIPAALPPHKINTIEVAPVHRLAMLKLAFEHDPFFEIHDIELRRTGPSYTFDTITALKAAHPLTHWYYIIGSDNVTELTSWHRSKELVKLLTFCVVARPGFSQTIPDELKHADILFVPSPHSAISSTAVRRKLFAHESCEHLVPSKVLDYIHRNKLYTIP